LRTNDDEIKSLDIVFRVFRHPGIKRELEERTKLNGLSSPPSSLAPSEDHPPTKRAKIEVRHCYYPKPANTEAAQVSDAKKVYRVSVRLQSTSSGEAVEWERKLAAALTLFGHPRKSDVLSTFPYLLLNGTHSVTPSNGKRSPSLPPPSSHSDFPAVQIRDPTLTNGNNNNNDKDIRLCLAKVRRASISASTGLEMNGLNFSPTVQLEKLPFLSAPSDGQSVTLKPILPRGSRPLLHRKAKDEPLVKPPPPPPPPPLPPPTPATVEKRKVVELAKPAETSFKCPICRKCFSSAHSLLQHGEQVSAL